MSTNYYKPGSGIGTGDVTTVEILNGTVINEDIGAAAAIDASKIADGTVSSTEFQYINSLSSNAQTQLTAKAPLASPTFTGTVTMPVALTGIARMDSGVISVDADVTAEVAAASVTVAGKIEVATAAEVDTGTDAGRAVSPDGLAGSNFGIKYIIVQLNSTTALTTAEKAYFRLPPAFTGMNLISVEANVGTGAAGSSSSGLPTFTIKNVTAAAQILSTSLTIDAGEYSSVDATTPAVIDTAQDDVTANDLYEVAVTTSGTGVTYATIELGFQLP